MASKGFFSKSFLFFHRFLHRMLANYKRVLCTKLRKCRPQPPSLPSLDDISEKTLVIDIEEWLLKSNTTFHYFMLVALEGGGFFRGLVLLCIYPFLHFLNEELMVRVMVMVCFRGMKVDGFRLGRAILPKYFLENVALEGFEVLRKGLKEAKGVVCVSRRMPRVMVDGFLRDYMEVKEVVGIELGIRYGFFTGVSMDWDEQKLVNKLEAIGGDVMAFGSSFGMDSQQQDHPFLECYTATETEKKCWKPLPPDMYPKPLIFHDGRLAFTPTPMATLAMFLYLPLGLFLSVLRLIMFVLLPYSLSIPLGSLTGLRYHLVAPLRQYDTGTNPAGGQLFICNHRTLLDPIAISIGLNRHVTAVTYSLSRLSEIISPIQTARLTRDKEEDRRRMSTLLARGDLVVCPEGTTCREPFLLRFSPLFAELTEGVVPVALSTHVSMFYGTSTAIFKFMDPFYYLMNPTPEYRVEFLEKIPTVGKSVDVANRVQREIGKALGFELTTLTRKDKYMMLAGNEGIVKG
ncbi:putative glycerol-3-phosphate acyltransferase 3 [Carex rostrata]